MPTSSPPSLTDFWKDSPPTRLLALPELASLAGVRAVWAKAECDRPLGNFKVLGGFVAGLRALARQDGLPTLICASDGNHGLAVAAAAASAGAKARVYLPSGASAERARRITAQGAEVRIVQGSYDEAVNEAAAAAERGEGVLVPDTSANPNNLAVQDVMDGYATLTAEVMRQLPGGEMPTHLFVQAGVGGLAAAVALGLKPHMGLGGLLVVVEPAAAACVAAGLRAGRPVRLTENLETSAEMLSCGTASAAALQVLQRHGAKPLVIGEEALLSAPQVLVACGGPRSTESGAAGVAGLLHAASRAELRAELRLDENSRVLLIITEGLDTGSASVPARSTNIPEAMGS